MTTIATLVTPLVRAFVGERPPVRFEFWDGSALGPDAADAVGTIKVLSADALRRILYAPNELGLGRAYVAGDLDVEGDAYFAIHELRARLPRVRVSTPGLVALARLLGRHAGREYMARED